MKGPASWNVTHQIVDPNNPLTLSLAKLFGGYWATRKRIPGAPLKNKTKTKTKTKTKQVKSRLGLHPRADVTSEKLCDDVLKYLAPTLEPYKGCTVIDINPGACLWSSKLHDFLKPKHHLLMEPEERYVDEFIKPLLDTPGSNYKHTDLAGVHPRKYFENYNKLFEDGILPPQPRLDHDDPRLRQLDTSFLVTGSLARRHIETHSMARSVPLAHLGLQQMTWSALINDIFHRGGLVRMLLWIPEINKGGIVPQLNTYLSGFNMSLSMGASVSEVVGVEPTSSYMRGNATAEIKQKIRDRPRQMRLDSAKLVAERMETAGIILPEGRAVLGNVNVGSGEDAQSKSPVEIHYHSIEEIKQALRSLAKRSKEILQNNQSLPRASLLSKVKKAFNTYFDTIEYPQCRWAVLEPRPGFWRPGQLQKNGEMTGTAMKTALFMDLSLRLINLEAHVKTMEEKGDDVLALKSQILDFGTAFRVQILEEHGQSMQDSLDSLLEDQLGFYASPQVVPFDRRAYEPLQAENGDFWPKTAMSLLDVTPVTRDLAVPELANRREAAGTAQELIKYLFQSKVTSVPVALDCIAPNAAQDLIPMVSAITDPRKGGRLDPSLVKVRMLTDDMIEDLVKAWFEWPFRPTQWQLALAAGSPEGDQGAHAGLAMTPEPVSDV